MKQQKDKQRFSQKNRFLTLILTISILIVTMGIATAQSIDFTYEQEGNLFLINDTHINQYNSDGMRTNSYLHQETIRQITIDAYFNVLQNYFFINSVAANNFYKINRETGIRTQGNLTYAVVLKELEENIILMLGRSTNNTSLLSIWTYNIETDEKNEFVQTNLTFVNRRMGQAVESNNYYLIRLFDNKLFRLTKDLQNFTEIFSQDGPRYENFNLLEYNDKLYSIHNRGVGVSEALQYDLITDTFITRNTTFADLLNTFYDEVNDEIVITTRQWYRYNFFEPNPFEYNSAQSLNIFPGVNRKLVIDNVIYGFANFAGDTFWAYNMSSRTDIGEQSQFLVNGYKSMIFENAPVEFELLNFNSNTNIKQLNKELELNYNLQYNNADEDVILSVVDETNNTIHTQTFTNTNLNQNITINLSNQYTPQNKTFTAIISYENETKTSITENIQIINTPIITSPNQIERTKNTLQIAFNILSNGNTEILDKGLYYRTSFQEEPIKIENTTQETLFFQEDLLLIKSYAINEVGEINSSEILYEKDDTQNIFANTIFDLNNAIMIILLIIMLASFMLSQFSAIIGVMSGIILISYSSLLYLNNAMSTTNYTFLLIITVITLLILVSRAILQD